MTKRVNPKWQEVQEETLTNWLNSYLKGPLQDEEARQVTNLEEDLSDGAVLIELLDNLSSTLGSGSRVKRRYDNPKMKVQMRENLASCFEFMKKEDIKLVNIGEENCYLK